MAPLQRFTRDEVKSNLVTLTGLTVRLQVAITTVHSWTTRYQDWPEPLLTGAQLSPFRGGRQAVYWWPDVKVFLARHDLPNRANRPRPPGAVMAPSDSPSERQLDFADLEYIRSTLRLFDGQFHDRLSGAGRTTLGRMTNLIFRLEMDYWPDLHRQAQGATSTPATEETA